MSTAEWRQANKERVRKYGRDHHHRHPGKTYGHTKNHRQEIRETLMVIKEVLGCYICSETDPVVLEYHHPDRKQKEINLADACHAGWSISRLLDEIAKCVVLCANCHRRLHAGTISLPPPPPPPVKPRTRRHTKKADAGKGAELAAGP